VPEADVKLDPPAGQWLLPVASAVLVTLVPPAPVAPRLPVEPLEPFAP
jgi:hypothetical protein